MQCLSFVRLCRAAIFAALFLPLLPAPASATSITCGFGGDSSDDACGSFDGDAGETYFFQPFGSPYSFSLDFDTVNGPFQISVQDQVVPKTALDSTGQLPSGQGCLPFAGSLDSCVVFLVTDGTPGATTPGANTWEGFYNVFIAWDAVLDNQFPGSTVRLAHARGTNPNFVDITIPGSYNAFNPGPPPCVSEECSLDDAAIGGTDDNFSGFVATAEVVPEPASMTLIATGLSALWYRRRRARRG